MMRPTLCLAAVTALVGLMPFQPALAAESYDNCTGFIDSVPATITTQGVWCLRKDLSTSITTGNAITIATNNVTLDCNDFKLGGLAAGNGSLANGVFADSRQNATIRNCGIRGFHRGIVLSAGAGHLVEDNRLDNSLNTGIHVSGENNLVQRNRVHDTGGTSSQIIGIAAGATVLDNDISGVFSTAANGSVVGINMILGTTTAAIGNRIRGLAPSGTGSRIGIFGYANATSVERNHVLNFTNPAAPGHGIGASHCIGNVVMGFATPYAACFQKIGNLPND